MRHRKSKQITTEQLKFPFVSKLQTQMEVKRKLKEPKYQVRLYESAIKAVYYALKNGYYSLNKSFEPEDLVHQYYMFLTGEYIPYRAKKPMRWFELIDMKNPADKNHWAELNWFWLTNKNDKRELLSKLLDKKQWTKLDEKTYLTFKNFVKREIKHFNNCARTSPKTIYLEDLKKKKILIKNNHQKVIAPSLNESIRKKLTSKKSTIGK